MYKLPYFGEEDHEKVMIFMRENSFAILAANTDKYPVATHVPLDINVQEDKIIFTGHIMKNTDHHKAFATDNNVLVIFNGPHCYVSAGWYANPVQASTWNYMTVHARGKIYFKDETETKNIVEAITNKYEKSGNASSFSNLSHEYVDRLVKAIIGFTIEVDSFDNVFKLSQNHEVETRESIIKHLNKNGSDDEKRIAKEMEQRIAVPKKNR